MDFKFLVLLLFLIPGFFGNAFGHTVDSVGDFRLEIGWMNEPVVSGETNGIELFVSPLEPGKTAVEQEFKNGVSGLEKSLKLQLILQENKITLPLTDDHDIPGKYYAFVNPTVSGFYQANIIGNIENTTVSLSMHPPKVDERSYIEFPEPSDITLNQLIDGHTTLVGEINDLNESVAHLEKTNQQSNFGYAGMGLGIVGIIIAIFALNKTRKNS